MQVSNHAKERLKERCGIQKKIVYKVAEKALSHGITHSQTKGRLNKWVTSLYFKNKNANNIRLYGDKAFIFNDDVLITVLQIPQDLMKNLKNMIKEKKE